MVNVKMVIRNVSVWTFADLCKILKFRCYQMLLKLPSLSITSLRISDEEANKFFDRKHDFNQTALLTQCYTQHAL